MKQASQLILAAILALLAASAQGQTFGLHTLSYHAPDRGQVNDNWGAYYRTEGGTEVGGYHNSSDHTSVYASQQWELIRGKYGKLEGAIGIVYGYQKKCTITYTVTPGAVKTEKNGKSTIKTTEPGTITGIEHCEGFSRGAITPLAGLSYTLPGLTASGAFAVYAPSTLYPCDGRIGVCAISTIPSI